MVHTMRIFLWMWPYATHHKSIELTAVILYLCSIY